MTRFRAPIVSFNIVTGIMQAIFLIAAILSVIGFVVLRFSLTMRGFAYIWFLGYLFLITRVMQSQVRENPNQKQRVVLNWSIAVCTGLTLSTIFISFIA